MKPYYLPKIKGRVRLYCFAGVAKPSPKMGQSLGPLGLNMMQFYIRPDVPLRVKLWAFEDRSFKFLVKPPPTSWFIKKCSGVQKGAKLPKHQTVGKIGIKYIYQIAKIKQQVDPDLYAVELDSISKMVAAQCKSMGIDIVEDTHPPKPIGLSLKM